MSVYIKEQASYLKESMDSILNQTVLPSEIILVEDGLLNAELNKVIVQYEDLFSRKGVCFNIYKLKKNHGLGVALNYGLNKCRYDLVARMDTDDISLPNRFEKQLEFMEKNSSISAVGSDVLEFSNNSTDVYYKKMPQKNILRFSRLRNPLCHPSVMFRKADIVLAGGYQSCEKFEDFYLWIRLLKNGFHITNIDIPLIRMRATDEQYSRRRGFNYIGNTIGFAYNAYQIKYFGYIDVIRFVGSRIATSIIPKSTLVYLYKNKLRQKSK